MIGTIDKILTRNYIECIIYYSYYSHYSVQFIIIVITVTYLVKFITYSYYIYYLIRSHSIKCNVRFLLMINIECII